MMEDQKICQGDEVCLSNDVKNVYKELDFAMHGGKGFVLYVQDDMVKVEFRKVLLLHKNELMVNKKGVLQ